MSISEDLGALLRCNFPHRPTGDQEKALDKCVAFLLSRNADSLLLLKGYAGTGKTSLVAALVKSLGQIHQKVCMLAPTGRAAKLLSVYAGAPAYTIHKRIYRQKSLTDMTTFQVNVNLSPRTLFIVDEASMIADRGGGGGVTFGTGRVLDDLMHFVYSCEGCRLMLVGDTAQLPPVGEEQSPAMDAGVLEGYGMDVSEVCLTQVVRQTVQSGILWNATRLRSMLSADDVYVFPKLKTAAFPDVSVVTGSELIETLEDSYSQCGVDETIVVTRSNKRAGIFNNGIRVRLLDLEERLCSGDLVMVAKNNYYWLGGCGLPVSDGKEDQNDSDDFIANGDTAQVLRINNVREVYGFTFADVTLSFPDHADTEVCATVILDTLQSEAPALTREQQDHLFTSVWNDYPEITNRRDRMKKLREDIYYNALQIKYAYAVTCHKAQGGQWRHVYIDQGYVTEEMLSPDYFRWLYTALTRATEKVYLVNWPEAQCEP